MLKSQPGESNSIAINSRRRMSLHPRQEAPLRPRSGSGAILTSSTARYQSPMVQYPSPSAGIPSAEATVCLTFDLRILHSNPKFEEMLRRPLHELQHVALHDLVSDGDRNHVYELSNQLKEEARSRNGNGMLPIADEILAVGERELNMAMETTPRVTPQDKQFRLNLPLRRSDGARLQVPMRAMLSFTATSRTCFILLVISEMTSDMASSLHHQHPVCSP